MILILVKKEIKQLLRTGQYRVAGFIVLILTIMAFLVSTGYYKTVQEQHNIAKSNERHVWEHQADKNPHSAAHYGTYAFKPKYPLSLIDQGVDKYVGISIFLEAHKRNEAQYAAATDKTGLARFGELTPDFILLFIMPLLLILLGHDIFTKEKERGTLRLIISQGINPRLLVIGKWLGVFTPIASLTLVVFSIAGILLGSLSDFGSFSMLHLLFMLLIYLIYYAVFTSVSLIASLLSKNSGISLVSLLVFWILSSLAIPKAATNLAELKYPYPTKQSFDEAIALDKSKGLDGHNPWSEAAKILEQETLRKYNVKSLEELPFNYDGFRMQKGEEHEAQIYYRHYNELKKVYGTHNEIYNSFTFFSPFLPTRFLSMSLARTDYNSHWDFSDAAEKYRMLLQDKLNSNFAANSKYGDWAYKADRLLWKEMPEFVYSPPALSEILYQNKMSMVALFTWLMVSFCALFFFTKPI